MTEKLWISVLLVVFASGIVFAPEFAMTSIPKLVFPFRSMDRFNFTSSLGLRFLISMLELPSTPLNPEAHSSRL